VRSFVQAFCNPYLLFWLLVLASGLSVLHMQLGQYVQLNSMCGGIRHLYLYIVGPNLWISLA
jgi:hypothetical protein